VTAFVVLSVPSSVGAKYPEQREPQMAYEQEFEQFHKMNPTVYDEIVRLARFAKLSGFKRYGIRTIYEVMRWNSNVDPIKSGVYRLNDNYTSHYSRLVMAQEPDLAGFFEIRGHNKKENDNDSIGNN
jgi:hypothetical protein